jgi:beta-galactosidase/beta-glucuronidase
MVASPFQENVAKAQDPTNFFRTAPDLWQNYQQQNPLRQRLSLHGQWHASCEDPEFSGEVELPAAFSFEGPVIFQRSFRLDSTFMNRSLRLVIEGTNYETKVELNGDLIGSHEGGYTPFAIDLRPERLFFDKENLLTLIVSNQLSPVETLPAKQRPWGWPNEGGILREIYVETLPDIFFENLKPQYRFDQHAVTINVSAEVRASQKLTPEQSTGVAAMLEIWENNRLNKLSASCRAAARP